MYLNFWFCKNLGSSLPIIGLQNSDIVINLILRNVNELIISKTGDQLSNDQVAQIHLEKGTMFTKYIFLEDSERKFLQIKDYNIWLNSYRLYHNL